MPEMLRDSSGGSGEEDKAPEEEELQFSGHSAYIVTVAKLCQQTEKFTDVNIQCKDGAILAHR